MRYSTSKSDPGYAAWVEARDSGYAVRVYVDGVEVRVVQTADDSTGEVQAYRVPFMLRPDGQECETYTLRGTVTFQLVEMSDGIR